MINPTDLWATRDHKHDLAFRPLETALLGGKVDAIYTLSKVFQHLQEATGKIKTIEDLSRYPDWTLQVANTPAVITCTDVMAEEHPELVVTYMKSMIKVGRWANEHKRAAAVILDRQTFYRDAEDTYQGIKDVDMVPNLVAAEPGLRRDRQGLHGQPRLHQERLRCAQVGRARVPRAGGGRGAQGGMGKEAGASFPPAAGSKRKASDSGSRALDPGDRARAAQCADHRRSGDRQQPTSRKRSHDDNSRTDGGRRQRPDRARLPEGGVR